MGRTKTGKSHRVFEEMSMLKEKHPSKMGLLLVPEQYSLQSERRLMELTGGQGIMQLEVTNFGRLVHRVMGHIDGSNPTVVDDLGKMMLLKKSMLSIEEELTFYKQASKKYGFNEKLMTLMKEAKRNMLLPTDLLSIAEEMERRGLLAQKLVEISKIYEQYEYLKGQDFYDEEDQINRVIDGIEASGIFKGAHIWIDGFFGFTKQEYQMIMALAKSADSVTVCLTMDEQENVRQDSLFLPTNNVYHQLKNAANDQQLPIKEKHFSTSYCNALNKQVEQSIFQYPIQEVEADANSSIFGSTTRYGEVEYIASEIIRLAREENYRFEDIAIIANNIEDYQIHIDRVFKRYGIDYFLDGNRQVLKEPLMQYMLTIIEGIAKGFTTKRLMTIFKSGMVECDLPTLYELENYAYAYDIKPGQWKLPLTYGAEKWNLEAIEAFRVKHIAPLFDLKKTLKKDETIKTWVSSIYAYLKTEEVDVLLQTKIKRYMDEQNGELASVASQSWNKLLELFDQLVEVVGDEVMPMKEFVMLFEAGVESQKLGVIPPTKDRVFVASLTRARSHEAKAMFLIGVNDGILPMNKQSGNLLTDDELGFLKDKGYHVMSDIDALTREEELYIYLALTKADSFLYLTYSSMDDEGKALRPSSLIEHISMRLKGIQHSNDINLRLKITTEEIPFTISNVQSTFEHLVSALRDAVDGHAIDERWWDVYAFYQKEEAYSDKLLIALESLFYKHDVKQLPKELVDHLFGDPFITDISRLENFAKCPFKHFVDYGLKPERRKRREVQYPDMGNLFHQTVEKYGMYLKTNKLNWRDMDTGSISKAVDDIIDREVESYQEGVFFHTPRTKYLIEKIRRVAKRSIVTLTKQINQGQFEPAAYEVAFDSRYQFSLPPIVVALNNGEKVQVRGRIDRIDMYKKGNEAYGLVMDYKSGYQSFDLSEVYQGLQLQLMTYLKTIMDNPDYFRVDKVYPAGVFYFKIDDPMVTLDTIDYEAVESEITKNLKLDGIVVDNAEVIEKLDEDYTNSKGSMVLPIKVKKDMSFTKQSKILDEDMLLKLLDVVEMRIRETSNQITQGNIAIEPLSSHVLTCEYCQYGSICQIDLRTDNNCIRHYKKMSDTEVKEALIGGESDA